ncbi:hypothetical protein PAXRUDRAFT_11877 [Paxillus rubicundulus Ve08.2h10]|uniref:Uncharacterized protein n=1 Tax=Paxillus rubicundulus Ve08.2h10 TaxID=930991 RepID=A0A0D0E2D9_9AGAM|nr:hypothetical protein PAXRUDRAFT_11877 [Paxillus rubicundulus Ve08.2h10]
MAFPLANLNNAIRSDFATEEHADTCQQLINNGIPEAQVSMVLTNLWTQTNEKEKIHWATRLEEEAIAEVEAETCATEEEAQHQKELDKEGTKILQEEHCKNKGNFAPVKHIKPPIKPIILPSQNALQKLKAGNFYELWYFTNNGPNNAEQSGTCA